MHSLPLRLVFLSFLYLMHLQHFLYQGNPSSMLTCTLRGQGMVVMPVYSCNIDYTFVLFFQVLKTHFILAAFSSPTTVSLKNFLFKVSLCSHAIAVGGYCMSIVWWLLLSLCLLVSFYNSLLALTSTSLLGHTSLSLPLDFVCIPGLPKPGEITA